MKITKPLWARGIFMTPQHFQQQALWEQFANEQIARIASPDAWGVINVALDAQALTVERLQLATLTARLRDGTFIDSKTADWLPGARSLSDIPANVEAVTVLAGVALVDAQGSNAWSQGRNRHGPGA
jgi:type VI secretion system protein ImpJ